MGKNNSQKVSQEYVADGFDFDELSHQVIGAAIEVHKAFGPGFLESLYAVRGTPRTLEEAFCLELAARRIPFERQKPVYLTHRDKPIGEHRLDLFVASRVVVELKAIQGLDRFGNGNAHRHINLMNL